MNNNLIWKNIQLERLDIEDITNEKFFGIVHHPFDEAIIWARFRNNMTISRDTDRIFNMVRNIIICKDVTDKQLEDAYDIVSSI